MAYFEELTKAQFKQDASGTWVYYPQGFMGKGRRIDSEEEKDRIFRSHKRMLKILVPTSIIGGWIIGLAGMPLVLIIPLFFFIAICMLSHWRKYSHLPFSHVRLGFKEATEKGSKAFPKWYPWLLAVLSFGLLLMAIAAPYIFDQPYATLTDLITILGSISLVGMLLSIFLYRVMKQAGR